MYDPTYDPATQTVAADDGSRLSIWEIDDCPKCGGTIHRLFGAAEGGRDVLFCVNALGFEPACDVTAEEPMPAVGSAAS